MPKMNLWKFPLLIFFISVQLAFTQREWLQSGPMNGYSEMTEVAIWMQVKAPSKVQILYWPVGKFDQARLTGAVYTDNYEANTAVLTAKNLLPGTRYEYALFINDQRVDLDYTPSFQTQPIWKWRADAPDFSFTTGSCFYINEADMDRPNTPYGGDYHILESIRSKRPDFMIWLGDNTYLREPDWMTRSGYLHRYTHTRKTTELQKLLGSVHHYAIWDDHDYGPNDSDRTWKLKNTAVEAFNLFWANPPFDALNNGGITNFFQWADCDFYLLDDRYHKSPNSMPGTILGNEQLDWLKASLLESQATFKFICVGVMFLSSAANKENFIKAAPEERESLIRFIQDNQIEGVVFLTGDRHFSELSSLKEPGKVAIYDLTCSPLTAGPASSRYLNEQNEYRVEGTLYSKRNFSFIQVQGKADQRKITIALHDSNGQSIWKKEIKLSDFKVP